MRDWHIKMHNYRKLGMIIVIFMAIVVLTGLTESQVSSNLLQTLPPDLNSLQGHAIFQNLL
ncbi:Uncharacterized [Syntrophomonas zehnderi OL-4]|uniref:Uncharacterized n=1 Tax=Syntrophomonas zehnderi OL-4 TaxID=690567 RepID=A0A0E4C7F8_9FIRM|nr:hypothetical protein [Syntrophomonas zehnderi]CFW97286.1 Uncharacterized [Syntrophomonas zehnderi OL-4]